jgi:hypothetical protein
VLVVQETEQKFVVHSLERWLAIIGALGCLILTILIWWQVSLHQGMWPLPALYLIEIAALSVVSTLLFIRRAPIGTILIWCNTGVLTAFFYVAGFSVGLYYLPLALIYALTSIIFDARNRGPFTTHLVIAVLAGAAQFAIMLLIFQVL